MTTDAQKKRVQFLLRHNWFCWARFSRDDLRCTGEYQILEDGQAPPQGPGWRLIPRALAVPRLTGHRPWQELVGFEDSGIREIAVDLDLNFLGHLSRRTWPDLELIDPELTRVPWLSLPRTRIEPDDWDLFWSLWNQHALTVDHRLGNDSYWRGLTCWYDTETVDPSLLGYGGGHVQDWSPHFPRMFEAIQDCMPWYRLEKVMLWQNVRPVAAHFDPDRQVFPWPDSLRVMLWDTNERPTFWLTPWPKCSDTVTEVIWDRINGARFNAGPLQEFLLRPEDRVYVDLPPDSNTFVFNNGAYMHGADFSQPKIIMAIKGRPRVDAWLARLGSCLAEHRAQQARK